MKRISKKFLAYAVTAAMLLPTVSFAQITPEIQNHWAKDTISKWLDKGYIKGDQNGKVNPNKVITRAEFVTMANGAFSYVGEAANPFKDVKKGSWYYNQVIVALANGYISGTTPDTFSPNEVITREQAAVIISKIAKLPEAKEELKFTDKASISSWAVEAVKAMVEAGLMAGYPDNTVKPLNKLSRAEAIILLDKAIEYKEKNAEAGKKDEKPAPGTDAANAGKLVAPSSMIYVKDESKLTNVEKNDLKKALMKANEGKHIKEFVLDDKGNVVEVIFEDGSVIKNPEELKASKLVREVSSGGGGGGGGGGHYTPTYPDKNNEEINKPLDKDEQELAYHFTVKYPKNGKENTKTITKDGKTLNEETLSDAVKSYMDKNKKEIADYAERLNKRLDNDTITLTFKAGDKVVLPGMTEPIDGTVTLKIRENKDAWNKMIEGIPFIKDNENLYKKFYDHNKDAKVNSDDVKAYINIIMSKKIMEVDKAFTEAAENNNVFKGWKYNLNGIDKKLDNRNTEIGDFTLTNLVRLYELETKIAATGSKDTNVVKIEVERPADNGKKTYKYTLSINVKADTNFKTNKKVK